MFSTEQRVRVKPDNTTGRGYEYRGVEGVIYGELPNDEYYVWLTIDFFKVVRFHGDELEPISGTRIDQTEDS